jgi:predicted dehydrogenase
VDVTPKLPTPEPNVPFYGHWGLAHHVVRVLRHEEKPIVTREEVLNVIGALEALYRSAAEGREIRLETEVKR